jgi:hypothetical protein
VTTAEPIPAAQSNRLLLAHLLLWMTTSAMALACIQGSAPWNQVADQRQALEITSALGLQRALTLAAAPIYGIALAGAALAAWRLITLRRGFPTEPGHWLLLHIAVVPLVAAGDWLLKLPRTSDHQAIAVALGALALVAVSAGSFFNQPMRWHLPFIMAGAGFIVLALQYWNLGEELDGYGVDYYFAGGAKLMVLVALLLIAAAVAIDLYNRTAYDVLHWIGIVTLAIALSHGALLRLLA